MRYLRRTITLFSQIRYRLIMTSSTHRVEEAVEELKLNPYYEKYAQKIAQKQQTSPEEFLSRVEQRQKDKEKSKFNPIENKGEERNYSTLLTPKKPINTIEELTTDLNKIMKIELIKDLEAKEIEKIWKEYHVKKDFIAATVRADVYEKIREKSKQFPTFLFPIPRSQGYEFIVCQFSGHTVHFTPLLYFQVHKENAPECLTITHYTEFQEDKQLVLMRGEFDKNVLNAQEAQCLANQLQLYYSQDSPERTKLMELFTNKPDEFKYMDLVKNIESLSL